MNHIERSDLPFEHIITDDLDLLLDALPPAIGGQVREPGRREGLLEVVLDLGRLPAARYPGREVMLAETEVTEDDLQYVIDHIGSFGDDNRAGIERTLHRISCIRNRRGKVVGLTCRVGRAVYGTIRVIEDLVTSGQSILFLGRPGVGKTTMLREVARVLADDAGKRVIIVDTSNEIAGDGDIPHPAIGGARRMQVPTPALQHAVMIEAVENHMPEVIVIDEIGTELEAQAARTIAERGVQLVGTAHGNALENLMLNPTLSDLIGGIQSVTLSDEEARRRGTQKSILERKAPPTFDAIVEIQAWHRVALHKDVAETVDTLLRGWQAPPEIRQLAAGGRIEIVEQSQDSAPGAYGRAPLPLGRDRDTHYRGGGRVRPEPEHLVQTEASPPPPARFASPSGEATGVTRLYPFGIPRGRIESAARTLGVPIEIAATIDDADAVLILRSQYRAKPAAVREAEERSLPIYVLKNGAQFQIEQMLLQLRGGAAAPAQSRPDPVAAAFRETEDAIAQVMDNGQPIELSPANAYVRRLQHEMANRFNLESRSAGREPFRRVKILPVGVPGGPFARNENR
ncbi:MAG: R3H domain-containing nucleic acid-binding protein [Dehalococcoidia bacterium]